MRFDRHRKNYRLYEDDEEDVIDEIEEILVEDQLIEISNNLGYNFTGSNGKGSFSVSDNVEVAVRYTDDMITGLEARILKNPARFSCLRNTATVDNLSVELQTCVLIIKEIRSKIKVRS